VAYLVLGALALWLVLRAGRKARLPRREWRFLTAAFAVAAFAGAAYAGLRESWTATLALLLLGAWLALSSRQPPGPPPPSAAPHGRMSLEEARSVLGVAPGASAKEIQAAYIRLMRSVHPDKGGTAGLAAQLNAARDRLLER
jgi:hypothetical protein